MFVVTLFSAEDNSTLHAGHWVDLPSIGHEIYLGPGTHQGRALVTSIVWKLPISGTLPRIDIYVQPQKAPT